MPDVLSYHVFRDSLWLADDEKHWTPHFYQSASFNDPQLANDIGERECNADEAGTFYVFACLGSM